METYGDGQSLVEARRSVVTRLLSSGNVSGSCTNAIFDYLRFVGAGERVPEILARTEEYGATQKTTKVDPLRRYPIAIEMSLIFASKDVLGWGHDELKELGRNIPRVSFVVKLFLRYFLTLETSTREASKYWDKHFDFGELEVLSTDIDSGNYIVEVRGFDIHPDYCVFLCGFLETMIGFVVSRPIQSEVIKCSDGDGLNRFRFSYIQTTSSMAE